MEVVQRRKGGRGEMVQTLEFADHFWPFSDVLILSLVFSSKKGLG